MSGIGRASNGSVDTVPNSLSAAYWSPWYTARRGASVNESLDSDDGEEWIGGWDGVGLYEGNNKIPSYQTLTVHLTSHRLILIPTPETTPAVSAGLSTSERPLPSLQSHLSHVRQTELYNGFMRSSAKITLTLGPATQPLKYSQNGQISSEATGSGPSISSAAPLNTASGWTCRVCGYVNSSTPGRVSNASKCGLCGVPQSTSQAVTAPNSLPSSRSSTPAPSSTPVPTPAPAGPASSSVDSQGRMACPACTFLNSPYLPNCEICSTALPNSKAQARAQNNSRPNKTEEQGKVETIRLSFRKGGVQEAYKKLKSVLGDKAWERDTVIPSQRGGVSNGTQEQGTSTPTRSGAGIDGILQTIDLNAKSQDAHMQTAFADLEALMLRAGEMVRLAQSLNSKLTSQQSSGAGGGAQPSEEEATMIRTSLVQLGLAAPALTQDMVRDEKRYHEGLAKELGELLTGRFRSRSEGNGKTDGLMTGTKGRGVIGLDEVWGLWMRARGVALLSPSILVTILPYLPTSTSPSIQSLTLPSTLQVLHTPAFSTPSILSRTLDRLTPTARDSYIDVGSRNMETSQHEDGTSAIEETEKSFAILEFAAFESLPIGLATELIELVEKSGGLVRDDQASAGEGGVRWYRDIIVDWPV